MIGDDVSNECLLDSGNAKQRCHNFAVDPSVALCPKIEPFFRQSSQTARAAKCSLKQRIQVNPSDKLTLVWSNKTLHPSSQLAQLSYLTFLCSILNVMFDNAMVVRIGVKNSP